MSKLDLGFPDIFEVLMSRLPFESEEEREAFLSPDYASLHDPMLLPDMEKARDRVIRAIEEKEHIVVYSDYDADGIPGAVVMSDFFKRVGYENVSFYIPHRHDEGFGLNHDAIDECVERGAKLLITIDCGTADTAEVKRAVDLGMDVVVTDHHELVGEMPEALAVVNPKLPHSKYPFKDLCGASVAYKLVQAILAKESFGIKEGMEKWSLDMVAIATLSDMVPLLGENRVLARFGLQVLRKSPRVGLRALLNSLRIEQRSLTEDDIAFMITPRINAASRMGKPEDAFNLLVSDDEVEAGRLVKHLEKINNERKGVVASLVKDAKKRLSERDHLNKVILIGNPEWQPSLLGLVANSLVEEYSRPAFVWGRDGDGVLKGSCRSYNGYDLCELMDGASDLLIQFGGHKGAGGFSVELAHLNELEEKLSLVIDDLKEEVESKDEAVNINFSSVGEGLWKVVDTFSPFGVGNEKPVFKIVDAEVVSLKHFGKEKNHLELVFGDGLRAIAFFKKSSDFGVSLEPGSKISLFANLEKSYFLGRPELRMRIVDIR